eukprot:TRINITY_DN13587_c0_g1_i1.p2 TRINITY_DN13587_c0_g1~~TRINITY_DN13587_c0_g1_i1.p2  ORF type:complete len:114 (-),score=11.29 TRINITY_DN13587_c0_g1_i1:22-363(-)
MVCPAEIRVGFVAQNGFFKFTVHIAPQHAARIGQYCFFAIVGKVLQYEIGVWVHRFYMVVVIGYDVDSTLVAVSYTHLTLPTKRIVQISVVAVSLKKKSQPDKCIVQSNQHYD